MPFGTEDAIRLMEVLKTSAPPAAPAVQAPAISEEASIQQELARILAANEERPAPVEPKQPTAGQEIRARIGRALSAYAAGINPNVDFQDYLKELVNSFQEEADRKTAASQQSFEDRRHNRVSSIAALQDRLGTARSDRMRSEDLSRAERIRSEDIAGMERIRSEDLKAKLESEFEDIADEAGFFGVDIAGGTREDLLRAKKEIGAKQREMESLAKLNEKDPFAREATREVLAQAKAIVLGGEGAPGAADQVAAIQDPKERQRAIAGARRAMNSLFYDPDLTPQGLAALKSMRERLNRDLEPFAADEFGAPELPKGPGLFGQLKEFMYPPKDKPKK